MIETVAKTQLYIKLRSESVPINVVPSGIKCRICGQAYDAENLEKHLITHVNPKYVNSAPKSSSSIPNKLRMPIMAERDEREDIWVSSFMPNELPQ
jgi:hypothetical protein